MVTRFKVKFNQSASVHTENLTKQTPPHTKSELFCKNYELTPNIEIIISLVVVISVAVATQLPKIKWYSF